MPEGFDIPDWVSQAGRPEAASVEPPENGGVGMPAVDPPVTRRGLRAAREREASLGGGGRSSGPGQPRPRPPRRAAPPAGSSGRHRGPSRRVRLHRTLAATTGFVLLVGGAVYAHARTDTSPPPGAVLSAQTTVTTPAPTEVSPSPSPTPSSTPSPTPTPTPSVVKHGAGTFTTVTLPALDNSAAPAGARVVRIGFQVEEGIGIDPAPVAQVIASTLLDMRGWEVHDKLRFEFVTAAQLGQGAVDITIRLASPDTVDRLCAPLTTEGYTSCFANHRAVLNAARWLDGVPYYDGHLDQYRIYMVNHEVGHGLGHGHEHCPAAGDPAPTMQQQTLRMEGCTINPWPMVA